MNLFCNRAGWRIAALSFALASGLPGGAQNATNLVPRYGSPGDVIEIMGNGFSFATRVRFNNGTGPAVTPTAASDVQLSGVTVPAGTTTGLLTVSNSGGAAIFSSQSFTVIGPGPMVTDFAPAYGAVGDTIIINGVHFNNLLSVKFGNVVAPNVSVQNNGTQITALVPTGATNGVITVTTSAGASNSPTAFTVIGPGPYISNFTPFGGSIGTPVTITGALFNNPLSVRFGNSAPVTVNAPSFQQFTVNVPATATTGPISVSNSLGGSITLSNFFLPPAPTNFFPLTGRAGTNVVITGTSLNGVTAVSFNGQPASFNITGSTQIVATVPPLATTGKLMIQNPLQPVFSVSNFVVAPTLFGYSPGFGAPPTSLTITGANLLGNTVVKFGNVSATVVAATNQDRIFAQVPVGAVTAPLSVTTTNGTTSAAENFFVPARILDFTPTNAAPGSVITITGENFLGATAVAFAGAVATFAPPTNNSTIYATLPGGVVTGPISVTTPAGTTNSAKLFYGRPLIFAFTPPSGLAGTNVFLTGTNFINITTVSFNGAPATFISTNLNTLTAVVPAGATTGPITVGNASGAFTTATNFTIEFSSDLKLTLSAAPEIATVGGELVYTVTLTNGGPFAAANVRLTNTLPSGVGLVSATTTFPGSLTTGPDRVIAQPGVLAAGAGGTLRLTVTPLSVGLVVNSAVAGSDYSDPVQSDNAAAITNYVEPVAWLSIARSNPASVRLAWPVELTNHSLQYVTNLTAANFWSNISATPLVVGTQRVVVDATTNATRFYRLRR